MKKEKIDIAIVGAGVSGVYSAWKLKKQYPKKKIVVFEGGDHVGGRLLSVVPPGIPNMVAELGGMRILTSQTLIVNLIKELNKELPGDEQITNYPFPVDQNQNIAYLRGVYLRLQDFVTQPNKVPYALSFIEKGSTPGQLITNAIEQLVPGITAANLNDEQRHKMTQTAEFEGIPLYKWGFWNVLYRVISGEAYEFCMDAGGYDSTLVNWNAADAIPWYLADFGVGVTYEGFTTGFQRVPITLGKLFQDLGGEIRLNNKLESFTREKDTFDLVFEKGLVEADSLILAMPRRSLDLITQHSPLLHAIQPLITAVTPRPLFKLFTTYANPWWTVAGYWNAAGTYVPLASGRTVTDLPVRQTYYWPNSDGTPALSGPAMLLASYDDGTNIGFWDGLRPQRKKAWLHGGKHSQPEVPFVGDETQAPAAVNNDLNQKWEEYKAPAEMVTEITRQLRQIHDLSYSPVVKSAAFRDWGEDPFGGGWNSWNIGVKSWEVRDKIVHPLNEVPLYICGEAYSDAQGWVEGALQTADIMLKHLL